MPLAVPACNGGGRRAERKRKGTGGAFFAGWAFPRNVPGVCAAMSFRTMFFSPKAHSGLARISLPREIRDTEHQHVCIGDKKVECSTCCTTLGTVVRTSTKL